VAEAKNLKGDYRCDANAPAVTTNAMFAKAATTTEKKIRFPVFFIRNPTLDERP
jgi:hypothetical protein